ncbi:MAG: carbamoyltransferase HypF [Anaerolineales bacterium]|nr:carbamoyltransferase HypF [Anaerolineales bacterium]
MSTLIGIRIHITGIVQGVGFRPFVYGLAKQMALPGWVRNTSAGVDIELDGSKTQLTVFLEALRNSAPPLARIDHLSYDWLPANGFTGFEIVHSAPIEGAFIPISPDVTLCDDCRRELFDPADRRYRYPFINCTNCGPRFTIIEDIPYDRPKTTMAPFELCPDCSAEYQDPLDRRFHAQPVACPLCGPQVWLENRAGEILAGRDAAIQLARESLATGKILAIKGLGGFHLACDASNPAAVSELRQRKLRVDKPFALMMPDLACVGQYCQVSDAERALLQSRPRPIVLLQRKISLGDAPAIAPAVAPGQNTLGVMLPYTPLHELLLAPTPDRPRYQAVVMTSGNLSEEPIAIDNQEARERLGQLADLFLLHDRAIRTRCDDSVVRAYEPDPSVKSDDALLERSIYPLRRSRGYAPNPIRLPWQAPQLLAAGPELKNTFCLTKDRYAFLSHHIGDMENYETLLSFEDGVAHFERLFRVQPEALVYDLHPDYLATRYAIRRAEVQSLPALGVQHHHAHIAAVLAEHGYQDEHPVIGIALDGTGYGDDGAIWGGEFLLADYLGYQRFMHLEYMPLPGGDAAIRKPGRTALALLWQHGIPWDEDLPPVQAACGDDRAMLRSMLDNQINTPLTSSMGRLFDAVAALAGLRAEVNYEAQAAIELENLADPAETGYYPFDLERSSGLLRVGGLLEALLLDVRHDVSLPVIAARFHNGLAFAILDVCTLARQQFGTATVALSGGVWQNITLVQKTVPALRQAGFHVYLHRQVPANDGGLALGQAAIGSHYFGGV